MYMQYACIQVAFYINIKSEIYNNIDKKSLCSFGFSRCQPLVPINMYLLNRYFNHTNTDRLVHKASYDAYENSYDDAL